ncbi:NfeD family protein [Saccharothrix sp.]|uniref:NfeD family protein n=1 Tax=Saccharothrix sp. TaxID=1873460 RepID=UPI002811C025|nr:NfeD family protein [Saccharothrix sp.]
MWVLWLVLAGVLGVAEVFTLTAALSVLGGAALLTAPVAALGAPLPVQLVVFTVAAGVGLVLLRPIALRHRARPADDGFGVDALIGAHAQVLCEVRPDAGLVKVRGEEWTARSFDDTTVIPAGTTVEVLRISGTTAFVHPRS